MSLCAALAILILPANAAVQDNESFPIDSTFPVQCANGGAGEFVEVSGNIHFLITSTVNGNNFSFSMQTNPQGVSGTGLTTGDKYQATGSETFHEKGSLQNGQFNFTETDTFNLIGQGPGNNLTVHATGHMTFNANGTLTVDFFKVTADCM